MTKQAKRKTPVTFNKQAFLLPKMEVTEYGFYVRDLGGRALFEFKEKVEKLGDAELDISNGLELMSFLVMRGTCDRNGHPVFTEEDVPLLAEKPVVVRELSQKILKLSGASESILAGFGEVAVNLKNAQPSPSTTESPTS